MYIDESAAPSTFFRGILNASLPTLEACMHMLRAGISVEDTILPMVLMHNERSTSISDATLSACLVLQGQMLTM